MIHYSVWFNLQNGVPEATGLEIVRSFLAEQSGLKSIAGFRLLVNAGAPAKTRLPRFQALIEFHDQAQFAAAFRDQAARGIHAGLHGLMVTVVCDFSAELFQEAAASPHPAAAEGACEI